MSEVRKIVDPFLGKEVEISSRLVDRLRGRYAIGPTLPNGEPEMGWRQMPTIPIQIEAADRIEELETASKDGRSSGDLEQGWLRVTINVDCGPEPDRLFRVWSPNMPGVLTDAVFRKGVIEAIQFFIENYRRTSASASASAPS